ncbi:hypothetical protein SAMN02745664_12334 [Moraxella cuniculi DSM 21768]|uniref:Uncharacterized protein n=1 Tax=Moraxella cuniculi DSM 21768 TaxID=1122245 RepID=A0A1N7G4X4_9GAMM|nr:hypothetical protein [Moraxella cuniculi]OOS03254.1 hypothetical protein B0189_09630 [Moraxella cuniculi]SIS07598.1 hypothetical protein SAMN02745664_12334 [Moraxella cuniculi DSM 21768]
MRYYYNPTTDQYAQVLGVDDRTGIATVIIDDKEYEMDWHEFIGKFKQLRDKDERSNPNQR